MKNILLVGIALLLLIAGCASKQPTGSAVATNNDEATYEGITTPTNDCYFMKHVRAGVHDCFGCSNGNCREPNADWKTPEQEVPRIKCLATPRGCVVA